jgi:hypothetical protein
MVVLFLRAFVMQVGAPGAIDRIGRSGAVLECGRMAGPGRTGMLTCDEWAAWSGGRIQRGEHLLGRQVLRLVGRQGEFVPGDHETSGADSIRQVRL